ERRCRYCRKQLTHAEASLENWNKPAAYTRFRRALSNLGIRRGERTPRCAYTFGIRNRGFGLAGDEMSRISRAIVCAVLVSGPVQAQTPQPLALPKVAPTVDQILSLARAGSPEISPDGRWVAYTIRRTNWDENAYDTQIWLADARTGQTRQLTASKKSSSSPAWSPDGSKLAFISDRTDKRQIYVINPLGGEAEALTSLEDDVSSF